MDNAYQKAYPQNNTALTDAPQYGGLTKRERFAMAAMQGLIGGADHKGWSKNQAKQAIYIADTTLNELERED